jgi:type VI secretion system VasD/TssJ family lipoprotein
MIGRRTLLPLLAALALAHCGPKPPGVVTLTMIGSADQNPDTAGKAAPVAVHIYQLTQTAKFERAMCRTDRARAAVTGQDAPAHRNLLSPGETQTKTFELSRCRTLAVVLYRDIDNAQWRADAAVATSGPTKLTLNVGKLAITLKPG